MKIYSARAAKRNPKEGKPWSVRRRSGRILFGEARKKRYRNRKKMKPDCTAAATAGQTPNRSWNKN